MYTAVCDAASDVVSSDLMLCFDAVCDAVCDVVCDAVCDVV